MRDSNRILKPPYTEFTIRYDLAKTTDNPY